MGGALPCHTTLYYYRPMDNSGRAWRRNVFDRRESRTPRVGRAHLARRTSGADWGDAPPARPIRSFLEGEFRTVAWMPALARSPRHRSMAKDGSSCPSYGYELETPCGVDRCRGTSSTQLCCR
eukprot:scaffold5681_cov377-Prasinococcus_capsulatus_cf.AAC.16